MTDQPQPQQEQQRTVEQPQALASPAAKREQSASCCPSPEAPAARVKRLRHLLKSPTDHMLSPVSRALRSQQRGKPTRRLRKVLATSLITKLQL
ncbi:hypothetical protein Gpo141_00008737 [Globisporangium polare]